MQYDWIDFYTEFATKLLHFKTDRKTLIQKIYAVYDATGISVPKLESGDEIIDIDPFTIFGTFNKGITNANRIAILNGIASEFEISATVPSNFDGIPVLNNLKATFYGFKDDRKANDIDNLWSLFEVALVLADNDTEDNRQKFSNAYNKVHDQLCIRWNITMALYWIRPYTFINLDSRNRWFISNAQNMPGEFVVAAEKKLKKVPYAADYLEIKDLCKKVLEAGQYEYKSFPDLSYMAWVISEKVNQEKSIEKGKKTSKAEFLKWFMPLLQALRDLGGSATPVEARKKIIENEHLSDDVINETRGKTKVNKFENEVAFARNYLVGAGYIDKSVRGVWTLTEAGKSVELTAEMASDIFKKGVSDAKSKKTNDSDALADSDVDTIHYWIYAPGQNADKWEECYKNGYMLLGWGEIGDLGVFSSKDEMKQQMKQEYGDGVEFHIVGSFEEGYKPLMDELEKAGVLKYHGYQSDMKRFYAMASCVVLPSYHEGMSNVLLEAAASGRPLITSDISGCREAVEDGNSGYLRPAKDANALYGAMQRVMKLSVEQRSEMGCRGRERMEQRFSKTAVVTETIKHLEI